MTAQPAADPELLTLEELSARVGLSTRTVRFYGSRSLIPPTVRRGRQAYYTADHQARLELVADLQRHGFTLAAIEGYLANIPDDATPEELALQQMMLQPWLVQPPTRMSRAELAATVGRPLEEGLLASLRALRAVEGDDEQGYLVSPGPLPHALRMADLGIPVGFLEETQRIYEDHARAVADDLAALLRERLWPRFREGGLTLAQMLGVFESFRPVSVAALGEAYARAMTEVRREHAARRTG